MELTDLEICKRIAEIEGLSPLSEDEWDLSDGCLILINDCSEFYNPLTDDALCFQLMKKHKVEVDYDDKEVSIYGHPAHRFIAITTIGYVDDINKAILLAIMEAHNESN